MGIDKDRADGLEAVDSQVLKHDRGGRDLGLMHHRSAAGRCKMGSPNADGASVMKPRWDRFCDPAFWGTGRLRRWFRRRTSRTGAFSRRGGGGSRWRWR